MRRISRRRHVSRPVPLLLAAALLVTGCGTDEPGPGDDTRGPAGGPLATDSARAPSATPDSSPAADSSGDLAPPTASPTGAQSADSSPADASDGWRMPPIRVPNPEAEQPVLREVRAARHDGYDRIVFEFAGDAEIPGYTILYRDRPAACGSGHAVETGAPAALEVALTPAVAHDQAGRVTIPARELSPGLPVLRNARITCDFEGIVAWVLGTERRAPVRVLTLRSPARLVVDLAHR